MTQEKASETPNGCDPGDPSPKRKRRLWLRIMVNLAVGYAAWCTILYLYQDTLVFPAHLARAPEDDVPDPDTEVIRLDIENGGQVEAWFIPAPSASSERPAPVVMYFHGNAEIIDDQIDVITGYRWLGYSLLLPEYRGYGRADGSPSQAAIVADAVQFYDLLIARPDVDKSRIVFHGRSLGGGVAAQLAARRQVAALILTSTFSSVASMASRYAVPSFLAKHPFRTDRVLAEIKVPLLLFHGTHDPIIPVKHGRRLHELVPDATYIEYDCRHNDFPGSENGQAYWAAIGKFLKGIGI